MVSTYSPNVQLEEPARGDQVGTWDTPVNSNMTVIDLVVGAINTISLNNSPVVLASAQYRSKQITFNSTLTGSCAITFPTSFTKSYEIQNLCTGSSAFIITLQTTAAGGQVVACPPGEIVDCVNDGTNIKFKNLGRVGSFWDYAGSSVPAWVSGCTVPPYLNCDGTTFSSATYPTLNLILGSSILPDIRGGSRATLNQGTARITTASGGIDGNTNLSRGGVGAQTIGSSNIPAHGHAVTDPGHAHPPPALDRFYLVQTSSGTGFSLGSGAGDVPVDHTSSNTGTKTTGLTVNNSTYANSVLSIMSPTTIAGICMIRAA